MKGEGLKTIDWSQYSFNLRDPVWCSVYINELNATHHGEINSLEVITSQTIENNNSHFVSSAICNFKKIQNLIFFSKLYVIPIVSLIV